MKCSVCNTRESFGGLPHCPRCYYDAAGVWPTGYEPPLFSNIARKMSKVEPVTCNPIFGEYFNRGEVSILAADAKSGKTWMCLHIATQLANGENVFGIYPTEPKRVLFMFGDQDPGFLKDRADKLGYEAGEHEDNLCVLSQNDFRIMQKDPIDLVNPKDFKNIMDYLQHFAPDIVFIDTLISWTSIDESKNKELKPLMTNLKELAGKTGAHICVLHHNRKEGSHGGTGLEKIIGGTVISRLAGELYTLRCDIDEDSGEAQPRGWFKPLASWYASPKHFYYDIKRVDDETTMISFDFDKLIANTAEQRVFEEIETMVGEWTAKDIERQTGESIRTCRRAIHKAIKGGLVDRIGTTKNCRYLTVGYNLSSTTDKPF